MFVDKVDTFECSNTRHRSLRKRYSRWKRYNGTDKIAQVLKFTCFDEQNINLRRVGEDKKLEISFRTRFRISFSFANTKLLFIRFTCVTRKLNQLAYNFVRLNVPVYVIRQLKLLFSKEVYSFCWKIPIKREKRKCSRYPRYKNDD